MRKPRFIPLEQFDQQGPTLRRCDHEGCEDEGEFRAPKSTTNLREYYWFCLEHIREYNKSWDFYKGMTPDEIEYSRISDITWNRPSWPVGGWRTLLENAHYFDGLEPFLKTAAPRPPSLPKDVQKGLETLGLKDLISIEELKRKYKALVKLHHPDLHPGDKVAEERLKSINQAYHVVKKYLGK